mgnify:CR=1 FL=1
MKIILASKSPRRKEILENLKIKFDIIPSKAEEIFIEGEPPQKVVQRIAKEKLRSILTKDLNLENSLIIAADTIVYLEGKILGQPKDENEAFRMLEFMQGRTHFVYTGLCLLKGINEIAEGVSESIVEFYSMTKSEINWYVKTKEPLDKAGSYGVQERGALFIKSIKGSFHNVMGFPVDLFYQLLKQLGVSLDKIS